MPTSHTAWLQSELAARQAEYTAMSATPYTTIDGQNTEHNQNRRDLLIREIDWLMQKLAEAEASDELADEGLYEELSQGYT